MYIYIIIIIIIIIINNNNNNKVNWLCMFFYMNPNPPKYVFANLA